MLRLQRVNRIKVFDVMEQETDTTSFMFQNGTRTDIVKMNNEY
jgi:hypothetical protein